MDTRVSCVHVYDHQTLLQYRHHATNNLHDDIINNLRNLGLLRPRPQRPGPQPSVLPDAGGRERRRRKRCSRKRKRGKRAGVRARLNANPSRPAIPSIFLSNVCSLDNKLDYIRLQQTTRREFRDCCVFVFTETWLSDRVPEAAIQLDGLTVFRADRNAALCGRGSVLNWKGEVEMDALVMDGRTLACGAVSAVRRVANPIYLARLVMDKTSHVCLTGEGASKFARAMGIPEVPEESLITEYARKRWKDNLNPEADHVQNQMGKMGTVGAVAVDVQGNVTAATSTGGMLNKMEGRVGDTPCVGCGGYADNQFGAVSPTGHGEAIMKVTLSRLILFYMEQGKSPEEASDMALTFMLERVSGLGGVVVVNPKGTWAARFSSKQMAWAAAQQETLHHGLYHGENFTEPV